MLKNDPALWTVEGIAAALPGREWGAAISWGAILLGTYSISRETDPSSSLVGEHREIEVWGNLTVEELQVRALLHYDATRSLGKAKRYELRKQYAANFGRSNGMAWYRCESMDEAEHWGLAPAHPEPAHGYLLVGQYVT